MPIPRTPSRGSAYTRVEPSVVRSMSANLGCCDIRDFRIFVMVSFGSGSCPTTLEPIMRMVAVLRVFRSGFKKSASLLKYMIFSASYACLTELYCLVLKMKSTNVSGDRSP